MKAPALMIIGKPRPAKESMGDDGDDADERDAFDSFADSAGIPEEKRDAAFDALSAMIEACVARGKSGAYEED